MNDKMFKVVNELLERYIGGQIFFTELDKAVKFDAEILIRLLDMVTNVELYDSNSKVRTIASGEIGLCLHNMNIHVDYLVPGGLRFDPSKINLEPFKKDIEGTEFIFIDDSYFSGKTLTVIKEHIESLGGVFNCACVAYDGAQMQNPLVKSLYRYYDHFDILGRPLKKG